VCSVGESERTACGRGDGQTSETWGEGGRSIVSRGRVATTQPSTHTHTPRGLSTQAPGRVSTDTACHGLSGHARLRVRPSAVQDSSFDLRPVEPGPLGPLTACVCGAGAYLGRAGAGQGGGGGGGQDHRHHALHGAAGVRGEPQGAAPHPAVHPQVSSLGDAKSSLGDTESSLGDAESSLGDAKSSLGDTKSSLGDAERLLGDAKSSLGDALRLLGDAKSSLGDAKSSLGGR
jgi:hypothetical protein